MEQILQRILEAILGFTDRWTVQPRFFQEYILGEVVRDQNAVFMFSGDTAADVVDWAGTETDGVPLQGKYPYPFQFKKITAVTNDVTVYISFGDAKREANK